MIKMAFRFAAVSLLLLLEVAPASADDLSVQQLEGFLCTAFRATSPEEALHSFPGAQVAEIQQKTKDRTSSRAYYSWVQTGPWKVQYEYLKNARESYGFELRIRTKDPSKSLIFESTDSALAWLRRFGEVHREEVTEDYIVVVSTYGKKNLPVFRIGVNLDSDSQELWVEWMMEKTKPQGERSFCR